MPTESNREVAERIAEKYRPRFIRMYSDSQDLLLDIEAALNARDERAAKIVNDARSEGGVDLRELVARIRGKD